MRRKGLHSDCVPTSALAIGTAIIAAELCFCSTTVCSEKNVYPTYSCEPIVLDIDIKATETEEATAEIEVPDIDYTDYQSMSYDWSGAESEMLAKIAMAEAESEGVEGKALVILVVLNRVFSEEFPDTIEEVIFQTNQFSSALDGGRYWTVEPDEECYQAIELVESGWDESMGATYFESCKGDSWHSTHLTLLFQYGNHKFYI